jgi:hypothetical protein
MHGSAHTPNDTNWDEMSDHTCTVLPHTTSCAKTTNIPARVHTWSWNVNILNCHTSSEKHSYASLIFHALACYMHVAIIHGLISTTHSLHTVLYSLIVTHSGHLSGNCLETHNYTAELTAELTQISGQGLEAPTMTSPSTHYGF